MNYLGAAAGGTLGYIHGNWGGALAGAKYGWKAGKSYQNSNMARTPVNKARKRRSSMSGSTLGGNVKRKLTFKRGPRGVGSYARVAPTTRDPVVKRKKKFKKLKSVRRVKITALFRKKVDTALAPKTPVGEFRENHFGLINTDVDAKYRDYGIPYTGSLPIPLGWSLNKQFLFGRTQNTNWNFEHFTFDQILDATNVLFFNKIAILDTQNYESRHRVLYTDNRSLVHSKWKIRDCSVTYHLRNNTQRKMKVEIFRCTPKQKMLPFVENNWLYNDLLEGWFNSMANSESQALQPPGGIPYNPNVEKINIMGQNQYSPNGQITNTIGATPNELGFHPAYSPDMRQRWNFGSTIVELEPGQEHTFVCQGPKNVEMNPSKWRMLRYVGNLGEDDNYCKFKPGFSESMFFRIVPELLPTFSPYKSAARFGDISGAIENYTGLCVQSSHHFKIEMPDITGTLMTLQLEDPAEFTPWTQTVKNLNRKDTYYFNSFTDSNVPTVMTRIDELNPAELEVVQ